MGVIQFFQIIIPSTGPDKTKQDNPIGNLALEKTLVKLKGIRVCIDTPNTIYSALLAMSHIDALTDSEGRPTAHINHIWTKVLQLDAAEIEQIWIFDSPKPNPIKAEELRRRQEKAFKSTDPKVQFRMNSEHVNDVKTLLGLMGITWVEAPEGTEAEQYGAWMTRGPVPSNRFCQYMISADSDVLAFGGNLIRPYQKPSATGKSKRLVYQVYELADILEQTGLTYDLFLKMCVAMGTDFCDKTQGVGVKTVIPNVKANKINLTERQLQVIKYYKQQPPINETDVHFNEYNLEGLVQFLVSRGFKEDRVREKMKRYPKRTLN